MHVVIVGGGNIGTKLAELFIKERHDVVTIEKDEKIAGRLGEKLDAIVLKGDASDRKILKDADLDHANALLVVTGDDKTNLMICEVAKSFKVLKIVARINDSSNEPIFMKLGITANINTTMPAILAFRKSLEDPGKHLIKLIAGEKAAVFDRIVSKSSKIVNKKMDEIKNLNVVGIYRNGDFLKPKSNVRIQEDDVLTICVPIEDIKKIDKLF